ncbi:hypothetical protein B0H11DRAFT_1960061 [Mycena galericulata]|nr:hypothetical protein B0H11DRAFT_1960061 [Mycena galericulata]
MESTMRKDGEREIPSDPELLGDYLEPFFPTDTFQFTLSDGGNLTIRSRAPPDLQERRHGRTALRILPNQATQHGQSSAVVSFKSRFVPSSSEKYYLCNRPSHSAVGEKVITLSHACKYTAEGNQQQRFGFLEITLTFPRNFQGGTLRLVGFNSLEIEAAPGPEVSNWRPFREVFLSLKSGPRSVLIKNINAESMTVKSNIGKVIVKDCNVRSIELKSKSGGIDVKRLIADTTVLNTSSRFIHVKHLNTRSLSVPITRAFVSIQDLHHGWINDEKVPAERAEILSKTETMLLKNVKVNHLTAKAAKTIEIQNLSAEYAHLDAKDTILVGQNAIRHLNPTGNLHRTNAPTVAVFRLSNHAWVQNTPIQLL